MAVGLSSYLATKLLDAIGNAGSFAVSEVYIQLHVGDPGAAGTSNPAAETTRKQASFAVASSGGMTTDADLSWTNITGSEDATHFSAWDASTNGNFLFSGTITANAYAEGDTFTIPAGDLNLSFGLAS